MARNDTSESYLASAGPRVNAVWFFSQLPPSNNSPSIFRTGTLSVHVPRNHRDFTRVPGLSANNVFRDVRRALPPSDLGTCNVLRGARVRYGHTANVNYSTALRDRCFTYRTGTRALVDTPAVSKGLLYELSSIVNTIAGKVLVCETALHRLRRTADVYRSPQRIPAVFQRNNDLFR